MQNQKPKYYRPEEAAYKLGITANVLKIWENNGKIPCIRTKGGHRRYPVEEINRMCGENSDSEEPRKRICYCRVSSHGQKEDLNNQIEYLRSQYPDHTIIKDIGSGLNWKRRGFSSLLDQAIKGDIEEIVITYRDRLCRFGFECVERIINYHGGKIVVLNREDTSPDKELISDLISIITSFSGRVHGLRSGKIKKAIREGARIQDSEVSSISENEETERTI
jgi:predicted site-specific integrase-resolvase